MSKVQTWSVTDVGRWLEKIVKLPQYKIAFEENEITGSVLLELKGDDLREIGVSKVGHRKQIELAIGALRAQLFYATLAIPNNGSLTSSQASLFAQPNMDIALSLDNNDASEPSARSKEKQPARKRPTSPSSSQHDHVAAATSSLVVSDGSLGPQPSPKKQRLVQHKSAAESSSPAKLKPMECAICMEVIVDAENIMKLHCGDSFCKTCIAQHCASKIAAKLLPVRCPKQSCKAELTINDMQQFLSAQQIEQFETASIEALADLGELMYCPTPNCGYIFVFDKEQDPHFRCEKCKQHYCLSCKCPWHGGVSCVQYRKWKLGTNTDDELFLRYVRRANLKPCPSCNRIVEKRGGCSAIYCVCGHSFCYDCGKTECQCGVGVDMDPVNTSIDNIFDTTKIEVPRDNNAGDEDASDNDE